VQQAADLVSRIDGLRIFFALAHDLHGYSYSSGIALLSLVLDDERSLSLIWAIRNGNHPKLEP
jgi:hypothetical protein